jgi:hypothetical protein
MGSVIAERAALRHTQNGEQQTQARKKEACHGIAGRAASTVQIIEFSS